MPVRQKSCFGPHTVRKSSAESTASAAASGTFYKTLAREPPRPARRAYLVRLGPFL
jgi:hypothetical protein